MKIAFDLTKEDLIKFYGYVWWFCPEKKLFRIKAKLRPGIIMVILFLLFLSFSGQINKLPIINIMIFSIFILFIPFLNIERSVLLRLEKNLDVLLKDPKNKNLLGNRILEFDEENFYESLDDVKITYKYSIIQKVEYYENTYFLFVNNISAIIIPNTAFNNDLELNKFKEIINNKTNIVI